MVAASLWKIRAEKYHDVTWCINQTLISDWLKGVSERLRMYISVSHGRAGLLVFIDIEIRLPC